MQSQFKFAENSWVIIKYVMDVVTRTHIWNVIVKREWNVMTVVVRIVHLLYVTSKYSREKQEEEIDSSLLASPWNGGEEHSSRWTQREIRTKCTEICESSSFSVKSCAKVLLLRMYSTSRPDKSLLTYALIDDQSNISLATTHLFDLLGVNSEEVEYLLVLRIFRTCGWISKRKHQNKFASID